MKYHPDRGGHVEAMKAINDAHAMLRELLTKQA
jgi:curved DNA-binding protein CbpA